MKIEKIITKCNDCRYLDVYIREDGYSSSAICNVNREEPVLMGIVGGKKDYLGPSGFKEEIAIPERCPLVDFNITEGIDGEIIKHLYRL